MERRRTLSQCAGEFTQIEPVLASFNRILGIWGERTVIEPGSGWFNYNILDI